jgi:multimeric flavodoxin WrbA
MKIFGIHGSPRGNKSSTLKLLTAALDGARKAGAEVEIIDVTKLNINYCIGCFSCYKNGMCAQHKDDFIPAYEKIIAADGVIFSSPVYIDSVTAQLKTFMDRMTDAVHSKQFDGKYGFSVVTSGGGGDQIVLDYLNGYINRCGGLHTGGASALMAKGPADMEKAIKRSEELGEDLVKAIKEKRSYPDQEEILKISRARFAMAIKFNKDAWAADYAHWVKKGWIKE